MDKPRVDTVKPQVGKLYRVNRKVVFHGGKVALVISKSLQNQYEAFVWWPCLVDNSVARIFTLDLEPLEEPHD